MRTDFIDFPTGWELAKELGTDAEAHQSPECSYVQTDGALLCDCGAIYNLWHTKYGGDPNRERAADYDYLSPERKARERIERETAER